ncbi:MAG: response regulator transcription factor [Cyanobium sp.]
MARFDPQDEGFRSRTEAINELLRQWTLVGASGSYLEAHLMARAALASGDDRLVGTCVTAAEVLALISSLQQRCLLVMVDSIAADHGEALVGKLHQLPQPPVVVLMVERREWLRANAYPIDRVEVVLHTHSFGSGALLNGLASVARGHRYVDPALLSSLQSHNNQKVPTLSPREQDTLRELARGHTNRQIATRLGIAESTAREYTRSLLQKLGARNRTMVVRRAVELGLLLSANSSAPTADC